MRFLGVDYGTKRIGIAISDEGGRIAFPAEIISNDKNVFSTLEKIIKKEKVGEIVIGESVDFSGKPNALSGEIEVFIMKIRERFNFLVHKQKEFLTSVEARRSKKNKKSLARTQAHSKIKQAKIKRIDASAAALILQRYLDKKNKRND